MAKNAHMSRARLSYKYATDGYSLQSSSEDGIIYTALVRVDQSKSRIPVLFNLNHHETFDSLKSELLKNCPASVDKTVGIF